MAIAVEPADIDPIDALTGKLVSVSAEVRARFSMGQKTEEIGPPMNADKQSWFYWRSSALIGSQ